MRMETGLSGEKNRILSYLKKFSGKVEITTLQLKLNAPDLPDREQQRLQTALNQLLWENRIIWLKEKDVWFYQLRSKQP